MQLRIAKHRVVRFLRVAAPLLFFTLVGALAWNYWIQRKPPELSPPRPRVLNSLTAETEGLTLQHTEGERTFYTLKARTHETAQDKPHLFRGVQVTIYGEKPGDPDRRIASDECTYDPQTGDVEFRGNVVADLDEKTRGRTAILNYRNHARYATARTRTTIEQTGGLNAAADRMEFGIDGGIVKMNGNVHSVMGSGIVLDSKSAVFNRKENWVTATTDVVFRTATGLARGTDARADLDPDTFRPKTVRLNGPVTAETKSADGSELWKLTRADRMDLRMTAEGTVERAGATGRAQIEKIPNEGRGQKLAGNEIVSWMDEAGSVENIEATGAARLETGQGDRPAQLTANKIRIDPAGTIVSEGASLLETDDSKITGRDFKIEQGGVITFATSLPSRVDTTGQSTTKPAANPIPRHLEAERSLTARFDGKTNRLLNLVATGRVQFTEGTRRGSADQVTATDGGDNLVLEGSATVIDTKTRIDGRRIDILQRGNAFTAQGSVKTVTDSDSGPVTVTANAARGASSPSGTSGQAAMQRVFYSGDVKQTLRTDSGPLRVTANEAEGDATTMNYRGSVETVLQSESGIVRILAAKASGNADKMTYTEGVQLWRDNIYIASDRTDVWPKEKRFAAEGNVRSKLDTLEGVSRKLNYDDARQTVRYEGAVRLRKTEMTVEGNLVNALIKDGRITTADAEGSVIVTQGTRRGTGDRAIYDAAADRATLTGKPARLFDPQHGTSEGPTAIMNLAQKTGTISGTTEGGPPGRVTSSTNIKR